MNFSLSESQRDVKTLAAEILGDILDQERLRKIEAQPARYDEPLWRQLAQAGLLGVAVAERHGGMGFDFETLCLLVEEAARWAAPLPVIPALVGAALPIQRYGSDAQRDEWLPGLASGEHLLSAALVEPGNADPLRPACRAERRGAGWVINGVKHGVPYAEQSRGLVLVAMDADTPGLFLLRADTDGVAMAAQQVTSGEPQAQVTLSNADAELLVSGADAVRWLVEHMTAAWCAFAVGLCDKMLRMTAEYTGEREQFGVKIATFQAVGQRAANCFIDLEWLTVATQKAIASLNDADADETDADAEQSEGERVEDQLRIAKIWAGDAAHRTSHAAQHLHGGCGVDRDYALFRYCLWAKHLELTMGSSAELLDALGNDLAAQFRAGA